MNEDLFADQLDRISALSASLATGLRAKPVDWPRVGALSTELGSLLTQLGNQCFQFIGAHDTARRN